jgi:beta-aspartyl-peptidase (threonine type)
MMKEQTSARVVTSISRKDTPVAYRFLLLFVAFVLPSALSAEEAAPDAEEEKKAIETLLNDQVTAWNKGDLPGFMKGYWESDQLTFFSGSTRTSGWKATLERYRKKYQGEGKEMGRLSFEELSIDLLGPEHALVRGRFRLQMKEAKPTGLFTLILRRTRASWRIIHDHTSS